MKKTLFIVIDALATRIVEPALAAGRLPNFAALAQAGLFRRECLAVFPSITPAATCSLATGCYPRESGIAGAYWYDAARDDVAYFGADIWPILNEGVGKYLKDFQIELNLNRLQAPTIFEHIEQHGRLRDAVINLLWFRGSVDHHVDLPLLFKLAPTEPALTMRGPHLMFMGDFVNTELDRGGTRIAARGGMTRRFGFHDEATADYLLGLVEVGELPDFTLAYFPNNDFESHSVGPQAALPVLEAIDLHLGRLFEMHGGLGKTLEEMAIVITGDHSQSEVAGKAEQNVDLTELLSDFQVVRAGANWDGEDDVMACPNMRAAQIYLRDETSQKRQPIIERLLKAPHVDQVLWCNEEDGINGSYDAIFYVATADRGRLAFQPATDRDAIGRDQFGGFWKWEGDLAALGASCDSDGNLTFVDYPNAFERVAGSFFRKSANIWTTTRLGAEFCLPETNTYDGGSHGSLHALDSTSPLFAAGFDANVEIPTTMRSVDLMPLCMTNLGLEPPRKMGQSHVTR
ncbi:MAG: alkaline phosphatase family protein [Planctomycetales bacterium]|nr:alkaline phosphatase family protein [Planctomycetales bacterium]